MDNQAEADVMDNSDASSDNIDTGKRKASSSGDNKNVIRRSKRFRGRRKSYKACRESKNIPTEGQQLLELDSLRPMLVADNSHTQETANETMDVDNADIAGDGLAASIPTEDVSDEGKTDNTSPVPASNLVTAIVEKTYDNNAWLMHGADSSLGNMATVPGIRNNIASFLQGNEDNNDEENTGAIPDDSLVDGNKEQNNEALADGQSRELLQTNEANNHGTNALANNNFSCVAIVNNWIQANVTEHVEHLANNIDNAFNNQINDLKGKITTLENEMNALKETHKQAINKANEDWGDLKNRYNAMKKKQQQQVQDGNNNNNPNKNSEIRRLKAEMLLWKCKASILKLNVESQKGLTEYERNRYNMLKDWIEGQLDDMEQYATVNKNKDVVTYPDVIKAAYHAFINDMNILDADTDNDENENEATEGEGGKEKKAKGNLKDDANYEDNI